MDENTLRKLIDEIFTGGRGILATDATPETMDKRMVSAGITPNSELRIKFREILLTTAGVSEFIGGVILNDEVIRARTSGGQLFTDLLREEGIKIGIKVDKKTHPLPNFPGEKIAEGLDGLRDRLSEYKKMGAEFAKFRSVIAIGDGIPTQACIESNSEVLARYAALCQEQLIAPIVEPEVLMDGSHSIEKDAEVTSEVLKSLFYYLKRHKVALNCLILKTNMILPGKDSPAQVSDKGIAELTCKVLKDNIPAEVPVVVFLSGGQDDQKATSRLNEISKLCGGPWQISFSFERALEESALRLWGGIDANIGVAQKEFLKRARLNSLARMGRYSAEMEN